MTENQERYDAGQPVDRLQEIKARYSPGSPLMLDVGEFMKWGADDLQWLIAEVERWRSLGGRLLGTIDTFLDSDDVGELLADIVTEGWQK